MADIHILELTKEAQQNKIHVIFHIAITTPVTNAIPTPSSSLPGISQTEEGLLAAGELYEHGFVANFVKDATQAEIVQSLKNIFAQRAAEVNVEFDVKYKYFGQELNI